MNKCNFQILINNKRTNLFLIAVFICLFTFANDDGDGDEKSGIHTIVIDAGHGGKDPGATSKNDYEKDIVLAVALKLGKYVEDNIEGVKVIYTRKTDEFIELYKRAKIANENNADLFISIHVNANQSPKPKGAETYMMGLHKSAGNLAVAQKENSVILKEDNYEEVYEDFDPNSDLSYIIFELFQNINREQSLEFAGLTQKEFKDKVQRNDRGVKEAGFLVLWKTTMPSVLIELGFISNPEEAKFLLSEEGQDYLASAIFRAFRAYKESQDSKIPINEDTSNEVEFRIQIRSTDKPLSLDPSNFKGLTDVYQIKSGEAYKYTVGNSNNYEEILKIQTEIKKVYPDCFTIALRNGKKVDLKEVLKK